MRIPVLLVTYNRLEYTKKALASIADAGVDIELNVWDNGSRMDTVVWLTSEAKGDYGIKHLVLKDENCGLAKAMNWFFRKYSTQPYVVKVDNDTVLPKNWLKDLLHAMEGIRGVDGQDFLSGETKATVRKIGAISPTCLRPNGQTFADWAKDHMVSVPFGDHQLHYNSYVLGTGVLINMDMIRERGLLFEYFPYGPRTPHFHRGQGYPVPEKTCLISGWTAYTRIAADYDGWKFAFYSKVHANLLNLRSEHVLSNDYPEYDEELKDAREQGNAWWESVGGLPGVKAYVETHGGLEKLYKPVTPVPPSYVTSMLQQVESDMDQASRVMDIEAMKVAQALPRRYLTDCDDREERSTQKWWEERVAKEGVSRSIFKEEKQSRINEFTAIHEAIIRREIMPSMAVLEVGCGWGRMAPVLSKCAASYVGVDFVEQLLETARIALPKLDFRYADAGKLPFADESFDAVIGIACVSSFDARFDEVMKELKRVINPNGFVLLLEEEWSRREWKLENK